MHSSDQNKNAKKWSQAADLCKNVLFSRHRGFLWVSLGIWRRITFCVRSRVPDLAKIRKVPAGSRKRSATISRMFSRSWRAIFIGFRARSARKKLGITLASESRPAKSRQIPRTQRDDIPDVFRRLADVAGAGGICISRLFSSPVCGYYMWGRLQRISWNSANGARARVCVLCARHAYFVFSTILRLSTHM